MSITSVIWNRWRTVALLILLVIALILSGGVVQRSMAQVASQPSTPRPHVFFHSVAFSPDGKMLATGTGDAEDYAAAGTARLWDVQSGKLIRTLTRHKDGVWSVAFSPDGKVLADGSGAYDSGEVKLWDVQTGALLRTLTEHKGKVMSVAFSPDGKTLASGSRNYFSLGSGDDVRLWDVQTGKLLRTLDSGAESVVFSHDGQILASAGAEVKLWNVQTGELLRTLTFGWGYYASSIAFSPDGKTLLTGISESGSCIPSFGGAMKLWNAQTGKLLRTFSEGWTPSVAFSPDGKMIASDSLHHEGPWHEMRLWDAQTGNLLRTLDSAIYDSLVFSPDSKLLAGVEFGIEAQKLKLWDVQTGKLLRTIEL